MKSFGTYPFGANFPRKREHSTIIQYFGLDGILHVQIHVDIMASYSPDGLILSCGLQVNTCLFDTDMSYLKDGGSRTAVCNSTCR